MKRIVAIGAIGAILIVALVPAVASAASWKDKGVELPKISNPVLHLAGNGSFLTTFGGATCSSVTAKIELTGQTDDGHLLDYLVPAPGTCTVNGLLGAACGSHSLTTVALTGTPTVIDEGTQIKISNIDLDYTFGKCEMVTLSGSMPASTDSTSEISDFTQSGILASSLNANANFLGTLTLTSNQKTYGL